MPMHRRAFIGATASLLSGITAMAAQSNARKNFGDIAPALADYTDNVCSAISGSAQTCRSAIVAL